MTLYQLAALLLMAAFYGCYLVKQLRQRQQGIQTNQLGRGKTGFVKGIEISLEVCSCVLPLMELYAILRNVTALPAWARVLGLLLTLAGTVVFILAVRTMKDSWRAGVPKKDETKLVTTGIFSVSRNPAFLGFDLMYSGLLLMFFSWPLLAATVVMMVVFHLQIVNVEEDFLAEAFGAAYETYRKQVCRYFGRRRGR